MKKQIVFGIAGFIIILVFFMVFTSFYTVKTGEVAIISSYYNRKLIKHQINHSLEISSTLIIASSLLDSGTNFPFSNLPSNKICPFGSYILYEPFGTSSS